MNSLHTAAKVAFGAALSVAATACLDNRSKTESSSEAASSAKLTSDAPKSTARASADARAKKETATTSALPSRSSAAAHSAPAEAPTPLAGRQIDAGNVASGAWVDTFRYERTVNPAAATLATAAAACKAKDYALCTTEQWERACAADSAVGANPTWTGSFDSHGKFIVRGPSCSAASTPDTSSSVEGAGLSCCTRAVSVDSSNKNVGFLRSTGAQIVKFEIATQKADVLTLQGILMPRMTFYGTKVAMGVADRIAAESKEIGDLWIVHDHCKIEIIPNTEAWTASCDKANFQNGKLAADVTRYEFDGGAHAIISIEEEKIVRSPAPP